MPGRHRRAWFLQGLRQGQPCAACPQVEALRSRRTWLRSYQHGRTETHVFPSVRGRGCVHTNTDGPGRTEKNGAYKETEADVVVVVETKGEQGALYP